MADNTNADAAASLAMLKNVNKRINEHVLADKPVDPALLALRDQLRDEVAASESYEVNVYAPPLAPYPDDL